MYRANKYEDNNSRWIDEWMKQENPFSISFPNIRLIKKDRNSSLTLTLNEQNVSLLKQLAIRNDKPFLIQFIAYIDKELNKQKIIAEKIMTDSLKEKNLNTISQLGFAFLLSIVIPFFLVFFFNLFLNWFVD